MVAPAVGFVLNVELKLISFRLNRILPASDSFFARTAIAKEFSLSGDKGSRTLSRRHAVNFPSVEIALALGLAPPTAVGDHAHSAYATVFLIKSSHT